jgi:hypothetical protein
MKLLINIKNISSNNVDKTIRQIGKVLIKQSKLNKTEFNKSIVDKINILENVLVNSKLKSLKDFEKNIDNLMVRYLEEIDLKAGHKSLSTEQYKLIINKEINKLLTTDRKRSKRSRTSKRTKGSKISSRALTHKNFLLASGAGYRDMTPQQRAEAHARERAQAQTPNRSSIRNRRGRSNRSRSSNSTLLANLDQERSSNLSIGICVFISMLLAIFTNIFISDEQRENIKETFITAVAGFIAFIIIALLGICLSSVDSDTAAAAGLALELRRQRRHRRDR